MKTYLTILFTVALTYLSQGQNIDTILVTADTSGNIQFEATPPRPVNDYELAGQALRFQISNIVKSSIQFDFELPVAKRSSLVFSPNATYYDSSSETVYGGGLTLSHRKYSRINMVRSKNCSGGIYISIKGGYNYLSARTQQYTYNYSTYQSNNNSVSGDIHQIMFGGGVGVHFIVRNSISIDSSIGTAVRYSLPGSDIIADEIDDTNVLYNGLVPFFRLGIGIVNSK